MTGPGNPAGTGPGDPPATAHGLGLRGREGPLRVTVVSLVLPHDRVPNAGGRYLRDLHALLADAGLAVTFVVPDTPRNREAAASPGRPESVVLAGGSSLGGPTRALTRVLRTLDRGTRFARRGRLPLVTLTALRGRGTARRAIAEADVVDLQWGQAIRLLPLVHRLNPRARVVGTFHDVQAQAFARTPATGPVRRAYWWLVAHAAGRTERRLAAALDEAVVFSAKDAALLGDPPTARVVHPPLEPAGGPPAHRPPEQPRVLMVSFLERPENDEAARWLLDRVWPRVLAAVPDAELRLVGAGASEDLLALATASGATVAGWVDDLAAEYAAATVAVVPLLRGAGIKFKTVEAMLHGVPVVATPVGAEGIGEGDLYVTCSPHPEDLAAGLVAVLRDPSDATVRAAGVQRWAAATYGHAQFRAGVLTGYGLAAGMGD